MNNFEIQESILDLFRDLDISYGLSIFSHKRGGVLEWDLVLRNENEVGISQILKDIYPYIKRCNEISKVFFNGGSIMTDQTQSLDFNIDIFTDFKSFEINDGKSRYSKKKFDRTFTINTITLTFEAKK